MSPTRRDVATAATRAALVASATECFSTIGFDGTSIADLTSGAGVSAGAFYRHFPDKRAVFTEIFVGRLDAAADLILTARADLEDRPRGAGVLIASAAASKFAMLSLTDPVHREFIRQAPEVLGSATLAEIDDVHLLSPMVALLESMEHRDELVPGLPLTMVSALLIRVLCAGNTMVSAAADMNSALLDEITVIGSFYQGIIAADLRTHSTTAAAP